MMKNKFLTGLGCYLFFLWVGCTRTQTIADLQLKKDSARLHRYFDSVYDVQFQYPDSAYQLWQPAAAEAKQKNILGPLFNYYKYAVYNRLLLADDSLAAYHITTEAMQLAAQANDSLHTGLACFCKGMLFANKEITDSASYYFKITAELLAGGKDWGTLLDAYNNLAEMMRLQGDYINAEKYLLYVQEVTRMRKEWRELAHGFINLYAVEDELGRPGLAKSYLDSSAFYYQKVGEPDNPQLLNAKGEHDLLHGSLGKAINYFEGAFTGFSQYGDSMNAAISLLNKAEAFIKQKNVDSAAVALQHISSFIPPETLPRTSLKMYYELKLSLPLSYVSTMERNGLTNDYLLLVNTMLEANKKLIGTEYIHQMQQAGKDKQLLQTTLQNTRKEKTIILLITGAALLLLLLVTTWLYWRKKQQLEVQKTNLLRLEKNGEVLQMRMNTQLEERSRISQELHDELGATLTSISLAAELLKKKHLLADSKEANIISHLSSDMVDKMNEIVWSLNTGNDNLQSLVAYIRNFAGSFLEESNISFRFIETGPLPEMPMQGFIRRSLYLTVKEALNNIVKHAGASEVIVQVGFKDDALQIIIQDNGVGITNDKENRFGNGIKNMKAHLKAIGGMIDWTTHQGTQINILSPIS